MSAHFDPSTKAENAENTWSSDAPEPANDAGFAPAAKISDSDAFGALADAVTAYLDAPTRLKDKRRAVIKLSELLREAFCLRADALEPLPKQLGSNHDAAADYIYEQLDRWAAQPALNTLFDSIDLAQNVRAVIVQSAMRRVPAEEIGLWLSTEFGSLTAAREAVHCRRYVATKISAALFDLSKAQPSISIDGPKALQQQLDDWASPTGHIEQSLHYQMVITPFLSFFHEIATGRLTSTPR